MRQVATNFDWDGIEVDITSKVRLLPDSCRICLMHQCFILVGKGLSTAEVTPLLPRHAQVLVCPPSSCLAQGCPGHEFTSSATGAPGQKLKCAAIDEMAAVGTTFELRFHVRCDGQGRSGPGDPQTPPFPADCAPSPRDEHCAEPHCSLNSRLLLHIQGPDRRSREQQRHPHRHHR